jgi:tetratricopeptide (TPR) repeat protein
MTYRFASFLLLILLISCGRSAQDYLSQGNKFFEAGKYADARLNYTKAIQKDARLGEAYYRLGLTYQKQNAAADALQAFSKAVDLLPARVDAKTAMADICFAVYFENPQKPKEMYECTAKLAGQMLELDPNSADGYRLKGALSLLDLKPGESIDYYRKANDLRPMNGEIVLGYMQALFRAGRASEAERLASAFLAKSPGFAPVYDTLSREYISVGRPADAEKVLHQWAKEVPKDAAALLRLADYYARTQKRTEMAAVLQRLVENRGDFPEGRLTAGDFYSTRGDGTEAIDQYDRGAEENPKNALVYRKRVVALLLTEGRQLEAASRLDAILKDSPSDSEARLLRARMWVEAGKPETIGAAITEFHEQLKTRPQDATVHYDLGRAYLIRNDTVTARASFLQAAQLRKDYLAPRFALAKLAKAQQNSADVVRYADEILQIKPDNFEGRLLRAYGLIGANRGPEARNELQRLSRDNPESRDVQLQLGLLAVSEKKFREAEAIFRRVAVSADSDPRPAAGLAGVYASEKQYDRAMETLRNELKRVPGNVAVENMLAVTAIEAKRYQVAIDSFLRVAAATPKSLAAQVKLAEAYRLNGEGDKAVAVLEKAKTIEPTDVADSSVLSAALFNNGRLEESRNVLRQVVKVQSDNAGALNNLAYLITETGGDLDEAQNLVQRALRKNANDPFAQDTLGWIYLKKNMTEDALQIFANLVKKSPDDPSFRYHLGSALLKKGDREKARAELELALERKPRPSEEKSIRGLLTRIN